MLVAPLLALTMATLASASAVKRAAPVARGNYVDSNNQPVTYRGCYPDNANSRTLSIAAPSSAPPGGSMTVEGCAFACASAKYPVSGTEFGGQCFCAQSMPTVTPLADDSLCSSYCNGDTVHQCGGTNTLSIYSQELLTDKPNNAPTSKIVTYKGCGTTTATGKQGYTGLSTATVDSCADVAIAGGYAFFAVNGQACTLFQADPAPTTGATCGTVCPGNSLKFCGDSTSGALNFYAVASPNLPADQRPTTITTLNTAATFTYQGCYTDGSTLRTLPSGIPMSNITPQKCAEACSAAGFIYAGLEYGAECWCGNTIRTGATLYPTLTNAPTIQPNCIMPCAGDATKPCGGGNAIQIWLTTAWAGFPSSAQVSLLAGQYKSEAVSYYGCFQDDSSSDTKRIFPLRLYPVGQMTPQLCSISCSQYVAVDTSGVPINYLYSGLQYGSECWCNFVPPSQTKAISQVQCTAMKCAGDANSWCGGGNIMTVYSAVAPAAATAVTTFPGFTYTGCSASFSSLYTYTPSATNFKLTVEFCTTACKAQGFTFAALSTPTTGNNQCDCGTSASFASNAVSATTCTSACTGNTGKQICGGTSSFSIYGTGANGLQQSTGATTKSFAASAAIPAAVYLGCYVDSASSRRLEIKAVNVDTINLTPSKCVAACSAMGLRYAGVEYGSECWCSNTAPPAWTGAQSTSDRAIFGKYDDCSMACSGATDLACGAGNRISIYSNGGASVANSGTATTTTLSNGYVYQGCAADQYPTGRVLRTEITVSGNSPLVCSNACATLGYVYAGVEFGTQCFCASSFTGTLPGNIEPSCNMPCPGSTTEFCGGSNFLNVYYNANIARVTLQTYTDSQSKTWTYKSCWGEPVDANGQHGSSRALNFPLNNNQLNTVESCLEMGAAAGYTMCGLEYGGECWCNNNPSTGNPSGGGAVPDSYCNTPCAGKIGNNCGGNYVLSVYARPS